MVEFGGGIFAALAAVWIYNMVQQKSERRSVENAGASFDRAYTTYLETLHGASPDPAASLASKLRAHLWSMEPSARPQVMQWLTDSVQGLCGRRVIR